MKDRIGFRSREIRAKIDQMAAKTGLPMSVIVRAALEEGIAKLEQHGIRYQFGDAPTPAPATHLDTELARAKSEVEAAAAKTRRKSHT